MTFGRNHFQKEIIRIRITMSSSQQSRDEILTRILQAESVIEVQLYLIGATWDGKLPFIPVHTILASEISFQERSEKVALVSGWIGYGTTKFRVFTMETWFYPMITSTLNSRSQFDFQSFLVSRDIPWLSLNDRSSESVKRIHELCFEWNLGVATTVWPNFEAKSWSYWNLHNMVILLDGVIIILVIQGVGLADG
jgi:hypothetical protein